MTDPCHNNIRLQVGDYRYDEGFRWRKDNNSPALHLKSNEILVKSATAKGYEEATEGDSINYSNPNSKTRRGRVGKGVAQTLDTTCNQAIIGAMRGRYNEENKTKQQIEINKKGTSNTLTAVTKDNLVLYDNIPEIVKVRKHKINIKELQQFLKNTE